MNLSQQSGEGKKFIVISDDNFHTSEVQAAVAALPPNSKKQVLKVYANSSKTKKSPGKFNVSN